MALTRDGENLLSCLLGVAMFAAAAGIWVWQSKLEAEAFNRVTGKNVSTWDAMFLDLRVNEAPR